MFCIIQISELEVRANNLFASTGCKNTKHRKLNCEEKFRVAYFFRGFLGDKKSSGHDFLVAESKAAKHLKTNRKAILLALTDH